MWGRITCLGPIFLNTFTSSDAWAKNFQNIVLQIFFLQENIKGFKHLGYNANGFKILVYNK